MRWRWRRTIGMGPFRTSPAAACYYYFYGNLGLLTSEGDDVNNNGTLDPASSDRILLHSVSFYKDRGA